MNKKIFCILLCILLCAGLCGCWDYRELKKFTFVAGLGIDRGDRAAYLVSAELENIAPQSEGQVRDNAESVVISEQGDTIAEALSRLAVPTSGALYYENCEIAVLGQAVCADLTAIVDFFTNDPRFRKNMQLAVAQNTTAAAMFTVQPTSEPVLSQELAASIRVSRDELSQAGDAAGYQLFNESAGGLPSRITCLYYSGEDEERTIKAGGYACFQNLRLQGFLSPERSFYYNLLTDKVRRTILTVPLQTGAAGFSLSAANCSQDHQTGRITVHARIAAFKPEDKQYFSNLQTQMEQQIQQLIQQLHQLHIALPDISTQTQIHVDIRQADLTPVG